MQNKNELATRDFEPQNLGQAMELAKMLASSDLVPNHYKNNPGNIVTAVIMGREIGLAPMQALQNIAVINGKPSLYGDVGKALLLGAGCKIEESDTSEIAKTNIASCTITRPDGRSVTRTFSVEDAKKAGLWGKAGPWTNYPWRQMSWRAFWFAARDVAADYLKGMAGKEEVEDFPPETKVELVPMPKALPKMETPTLDGTPNGIPALPQSETKEEKKETEGNESTTVLAVLTAVKQNKKDNTYKVETKDGDTFALDPTLLNKAIETKNHGREVTLNLVFVDKVLTVSEIRWTA